MQTPAIPKAGRRLSLAAVALLCGACTMAPEPGEDDRLAVVFTRDDGRELAVGTYDAESGELTFNDHAQDDMRERLAGAGYTAMVELDGDAVDVDLDAGVAWVDVDLAEGEALELRVTQPGAPTLSIGHLVLQREDFRAGDTWKLGNKVWQDDWLSPA
jgi:hypothetical protein